MTSIFTGTPVNVILVAVTAVIYSLALSKSKSPAVKLTSASVKSVPVRSIPATYPAVGVAVYGAAALINLIKAASSSPAPAIKPSQLSSHSTSPSSSGSTKPPTVLFANKILAESLKA